jgi:hypothetical protein
MRLLTRALLCGLLLWHGQCLLLPNLRAQEPADFESLVPDFSAQQRAELTNSFGVYTNALSIFTGLDAASTGSFRFKGNEQEAGTDLEIVRLPFSYSFGEQGDRLRPVVRGVVGYFKSTSTVRGFSEVLKESASELPEEINALPNQADFSKDTATSVSLGGGLKVAPIDGLSVTPGFDLIWTHLKRKFDYNNFLSSLLGSKFDRELFNTSVEAISYVPSLRVAYDWNLFDGMAVTTSSDYSHVWTYDLWSKSSLGDFHTDSGVWRNTLEAQIETPLTLADLPVGVHPFIVRTDVSKAAHDSLGFSYLHDLGADITLDVSSRSTWIERLKLGAAYIFAHDFSGYRVGLGVDM